jgi:hypothetical protein
VAAGVDGVPQTRHGEVGEFFADRLKSMSKVVELASHVVIVADTTADGRVTVSLATMGAH